MDSTIFSRLEDLAACLCAAVDDTSSMCFCGILPGEQWYDVSDCEDNCGQAWVRVAQVFPARSLGEPDVTYGFTDTGNCGAVLSLTVEMGVLRCLEIPEDGTAQSAPILLAAAEQQMKDMLDIRKAVVCCTSFSEKLMGVWTPIGPVDGSVIGGFWTVTLGSL